MQIKVLCSFMQKKLLTQQLSLAVDCPQAVEISKRLANKSSKFVWEVLLYRARQHIMYLPLALQ